MGEGVRSGVYGLKPKINISAGLEPYFQAEMHTLELYIRELTRLIFKIIEFTDK